MRMMLNLVWLLVAALVPGWQAALDAREMRAFKSIPTAETRKMDLPENARRTEAPEPVDRDIVKEGLHRMNQAWNSPGFSSMVSDQFYDKSRLGDAMSQTAQYSTTLSLEGMENVQILDQYVVDHPDGTKSRVSKVSAVARTRNEFEDASAGKVSSPGTNEIIFEITEKLP